MKGKIFYVIKLFVSAVIALGILSIFTIFYYNPPIAVPQPDKITNNKFQANRFWCDMTEGFGYGKIDCDGYNNAYYNEITEPDIVFMGSSQLASVQVPYHSNFIYLLNKKFAEDNHANNNFQCLNLGMAAHYFPISVSNFNFVAEKYKDAEYIVIEAQTLKFTMDELDKMLAGEYHSDMSERGFLYQTVQKIPYARLVYKKLSDFSKDDSETTDTLTNNTIDWNEYNKKLNAVIKKLADTAEEYDLKLMILHHNTINVSRDSDIVCTDEEIYEETFEKCCNVNHVTYMNVVDRFISNYRQEFEMPYGFSNTVPGKGHLNKIGHRIISEELYQQINRMKEGE